MSSKSPKSPEQLQAELLQLRARVAELERQLAPYVDDEGHQRDARERIAQLLDKELAVLKYLAAGDTNKSIAKRLGVSVRTVETHRHNIRAKLRVRSTAETLKIAFAGGL